MLYSKGTVRLFVRAAAPIPIMKCMVDINSSVRAHEIGIFSPEVGEFVGYRTVSPNGLRTTFKYSLDCHLLSVSSSCANTSADKRTAKTITIVFNCLFMAFFVSYALDNRLMSYPYGTN